MLLRFTAVALALVASAPLTAAPQKTIAPNTNVGDPNERICENLVVTGSRLATKRFCGTRAEWADRKRQDREALDAAQKSPCVISATSGSGRASC